MIDPGGRGDYRWMAQLPRQARVVMHESIASFLKTDQLQDYRPFPKQLDFHLRGKAFRNRMLRAGNQLGKTFSAAAEAAYHLTGEYPSWWQGKRFDRPIVLWASGVTGEATRDNAQRNLIGPPKQLGTGLIPKRCITPLYGRAKGTSDLYDYIMIRHKSGGLSMLKFRYYAQGREAWQGPPVDLVWFDEEPPMDIYEEGLARTIAVHGISMMTFTPLLGYTDVVNLYLKDPDPEHSGRCETLMTVEDALECGHFTKQQYDEEIARWPKHQQRARLMGEPAIGVGQIYPYDPETLKVEPFAIPPEWPVIGGIDLAGGSSHPKAHPTAAVKLAWDRDNDCVYMVKEYRKKGMRPPEVWIHLRYWGRDLRWAWPKDAAFEEKGSGDQLIALYRNEGMKALPIHAQYPKRTRKHRNNDPYRNSPASIVSVERGIADISTRMETDRFKVFENCPMFFGEMQQYHRDEDGKIVKILDDLLDATRYGIMMLRFAQTSVPVRRVSMGEADWHIGI